MTGLLYDLCEISANSAVEILAEGIKKFPSSENENL
jgi:hypothetical protein